MKTRHCVFPTGITAYEHEPYTRQDVLEYEGRWYVCGTGRQPLQRDKTASGGYYLLTLAAIAKELRQRGIKGRCSVILAAGLPLTGFGREKEGFEKYLRRSSQPVQYRYEDVSYEVTITDVKLFPQRQSKRGAAAAAPLYFDERSGYLKKYYTAESVTDDASE
mgnify:CR=1 FL=1